MDRLSRVWHVLILGAMALGLPSPGWAAGFSIARIYIEYNSSANDLGFHVSLDGEDWRALRIVNPAGTEIFDLDAEGAYRELGLTELFFEGAEPSLDEFPLEELLARFPEGKYKFLGTTVGGTRLASTGTLSHAVPAGPSVSAEVTVDDVVIRWTEVTGPPEGFPDKPIQIVGYQVIVASFQVTLPASSREVTLPREFVASLGRGTHDFEVLAIDATGNQTITEGTFDTQ
jgi:hypothetical protein